MLQECNIEPLRHVSKIRELFINLRPIDVLEVNIANKKNPNYGVNDFVHDICSEDYESYIVMDGDIPIGVYGISKSTLNGMYCIYFLGSKILDERLDIKKAFIKRSVSIINEWLETRECLFNFVHKDNVKSKRWLVGLGAWIYDTVDDDGMQLFTIRKGDLNVQPYRTCRW